MDQHGSKSLIAIVLLTSAAGCSVPVPNAPPEQTFAQQAEVVRAGLSTQIRVDNDLVRDEDLKTLDGLEQPILRVNLSHTQITDAGLERLSQLKNLEQLRLSSPLVTDRGLAHLKKLKKLRFLHLLDMPITDAGLDELHALTTLESLYLDNTRATHEGISRLLEALPHVHLHVDDHHPEPRAGLDDRRR